MVLSSSFWTLGVALARAKTGSGMGATTAFEAASTCCDVVRAGARPIAALPAGQEGVAGVRMLVAG